MFNVRRFSCGKLARTPTSPRRSSNGLTVGSGRVLVGLSLAIYCALSARVVSAAPPGLPPTNGPEILQKLAKKWANQEKEISSASIRFRLFRQGGFLKPCTPAEMTAKLQGVDFVKDPEAMRRFLSSIYPFGQIPPNVHIMRTPNPWEMMEFKMAGERRREEGLDFGNVQVATPDVKVETDQANRQIHIYALRGSTRGIIGIADFRRVLKFDPSMSVRTVADPIAVIATSAGQFGHGESRVDIESGALLESAFYDHKG